MPNNYMLNREFPIAQQNKLYNLDFEQNHLPANNLSEEQRKAILIKKANEYNEYKRKLEIKHDSNPKQVRKALVFNDGRKRTPMEVEIVVAKIVAKAMLDKENL